MLNLRIEYEELMAMDVEGIISSSHSIRLLNLYSKIFLNGAEPRSCATSQRSYYQILKSLSMEQVNRLDQKRTCQPNWVGLRYINGRHYSPDNITDEEALTLLKAGLLTDANFKKTPDGWRLGKVSETPATPKPKAKRTRTKKAS